MMVYILLLALMPPAALWLSAVGNPLDYLGPSVPDGQLLYVLSKLAGLCAVSLFTAQLLLMVLRGTPLGPSMQRWPTRVHAILGGLVVLVALLHVLLFVAAASVRSDHIAFSLLLPRLNSGFYDRMVSLGALAFYSLLALAVFGAITRKGRLAGITFANGKHLRPKIRSAHMALVFMVVPVIIVHSYSVGSETGTLMIVAFYVVLAATAVFGLWRVLTKLRTKSGL